MCTRALHMSSPLANRSIVDLVATVQKNKDTPKAIRVMPALSGADTVTATYNVEYNRQPERNNSTGNINNSYSAVE